MSTGKKLAVKQGYIPATCTLPDELAFALVLSEEKSGRRACWGCNHDRRVCHGEPKQVAFDEFPATPAVPRKRSPAGKPNRVRRHW